MPIRGCGNDAGQINDPLDCPRSIPTRFAYNETLARKILIYVIGAVNSRNPGKCLRKLRDTQVTRYLLQIIFGLKGKKSEQITAMLYLSTIFCKHISIHVALL